VVDDGPCGVERSLHLVVLRRRRRQRSSPTSNGKRKPILSEPPHPQAPVVLVASVAVAVRVRTAVATAGLDGAVRVASVARLPVRVVARLGPVEPPVAADRGLALASLAAAVALHPVAVVALLAVVLRAVAARVDERRLVRRRALFAAAVGMGLADRDVAAARMEFVRRGVSWALPCHVRSVAARSRSPPSSPAGAR
jgi:hypothetical protein